MLKIALNASPFICSFGRLMAAFADKTALAEAEVTGKETIVFWVNIYTAGW